MAKTAAGYFLCVVAKWSRFSKWVYYIDKELEQLEKLGVIMFQASGHDWICGAQRVLSWTLLCYQSDLYSFLWGGFWVCFF